MSGRFLGVDPGAARVGLALSDEDGTLALPRGSVAGHGTPAQVAARVREALADVPLAGVVVGLPLRLDGSEGMSAKLARALGRALKEALAVKVVYRDERLTTVQAERSLGELGIRGRDRRKAVDAAAAAVLLQSFLDARTGGSWDAHAEPARDPRAQRGDGPRKKRSRDDGSSSA